MSVSCSQCGEELFGAVNRCWKCGQAVSANSDSSGVPPVRRGPVDVAFPTTLIEPDATELDSPTANVVVAQLAETVATVAGPTPSPSPIKTAPLAATYPEFGFRSSLAISCCFVAGMALLASFVTKWAVVPAALAIVFAWFGFYSPKWKFALAGLALAILGFSFAGVQTVRDFETYRQRQIDLNYPDNSF